MTTIKIKEEKTITIKEGDWVKLCYSPFDWVEQMRPFVGRVVKVGEIAYLGNARKFVYGGYKWYPDEGHCIKVPPPPTYERCKCSQEIECDDNITQYRFGNHTVEVNFSTETLSVNGYSYDFEEFNQLIETFINSVEDESFVIVDTFDEYNVEVEMEDNTKVDIGCYRGTYKELKEILTDIDAHLNG